MSAFTFTVNLTAIDVDRLQSACVAKIQELQDEIQRCDEVELALSELNALNELCDRMEAALVGSVAKAAPQ